MSRRIRSVSRQDSNPPPAINVIPHFQNPRQVNVDPQPSLVHPFSSSSGNAVRMQLHGVHGVHGVVRHRSLAISNESVSYRDRLDTWLAEGGRGEYASRLAAVEQCMRCVRDGDKALVLSPGRLTKLPPLPPHIEEIHASGNKIKNLPERSFWPANLKVIDLSQNQLVKIEGRNLPESLERIQIPRNKIKKIKGPFCPNLRKIFLAHNRLEELPQAWPDNLDELDLQNCGLPFFPEGLPIGIRSIDVSHNPIEEVYGEDMPASIQILNLSQTHIGAIPDNLPESLCELNLSGVQFDDYDGEVYEPESLPTGITIFNFKDCNLVEVPDFIARLSGDISVDLRGNPLSSEALQQIQQFQATLGGLDIHISEQGQSLADEVLTWLEKANGYLRHDTQHAAWIDIQNSHEAPLDAKAFANFLGKLRGTPECQNEDDNAILLHRVHRLIFALKNTPALRADCMRIASSELENEDVRPISILEKMEAEHARWLEEHGYENQVVKLSSRAEYRAACLDPQPDTTYIYHDLALVNNELTFATDQLGRAISSSGQLRISKEKQRFHDDSKIGFPHNPDALPGDIGFHAGANQFGFPGGQLNIYPGNTQLNAANGAYGKFENEVLRPLVANPRNTVEAQFTRIFYDGNTSSRPDEMQIIYNVNDQPPVTTTFLNMADSRFS